MRKKVLLIAPPHMDIYSDIEAELEIQGYDVDCMVLNNPAKDPFFMPNPESAKIKSESEKITFLNHLDTYWSNVYSKGGLRKSYDYLLVINGTTIHPRLFSYLKESNPHIKCVAFLYDSVTLYGFDRNFGYYDEIFSFNKKDAVDYNLKFLPIYWKPVQIIDTIDCYAFGMGVYSKTRYKVYKKIEDVCKKNKLSFHIKLYIPEERNKYLFGIKNFVHKLMGNRSQISYREYNSDLVTHHSMSPEIFRQHIANSTVVIDTSNPHQDGLTARFMWALGEGKKIVTNNPSVKEYSFYDPKQFFIIDDDDISQLESFMLCPFKPSDEYYEVVNQWRIDNWLKTLLGESVNY